MIPCPSDPLINFGSMSDLISIIMPVYNREEFVRDSIQSVLNQSHSNWELLIVNDGSTDGSRREILKFTDSRIRYFEQTNQGVSAARNLGLSRMKGDYFCFLDSDDVFTARSLASRLKVFREGPANLNFVDGVVEERDKKLDQVTRVYRPSFRGNPFREMLKISESCYVGQTWMLRRKQNQKYYMTGELSNGEDYFFLLEQARHGGVYDYTNETIMYYRRHSASASANLDGLNNSYLLIHKKIRAWPDVPAYAALYYWLKSRKIMFLSYMFDGKSVRKAFRSLFQWA